MGNEDIKVYSKSELRRMEAQRGIREMDRVRWVDHENVEQSGYVMAVLSAQYLVADSPDGKGHQRFVLKTNTTLKRIFNQ